MLQIDRAILCFFVVFLIESYFLLRFFSYLTEKINRKQLGERCTFRDKMV